MVGNICWYSSLLCVCVSDALYPEFSRVCQQWSANCWTTLHHFEVDASICQVRLATFQLLALSCDHLPDFDPYLRCLLWSRHHYVLLLWNFKYFITFYFVGNVVKVSETVQVTLSRKTLASSA